MFSIRILDFDIRKVLAPRLWRTSCLQILAKIILSNGEIPWLSILLVSFGGCYKCVEIHHTFPESSQQRNFDAFLERIIKIIIPCG